MADQFQYAAFISYKSEDAKFAKRVHKALETYRIPRSLGPFDLTGSGDRKFLNRIYPVFRDRDELASGDLSSKIEGALRASRVLIVIGSPGAATSEYVAKEVDYFLELGRRDRIFGIISADAGPSGSNVLEAFFPPSLSAARLDLVAGDARVGGVGKHDGFRNALLKVIAGVIEKSQGELTNRDRARRQRSAIAMTVGGIAVAAVGLVGLRFAIAPMVQAEVSIARESTRREVQRAEAGRRVEIELEALAARAWQAAEADAPWTNFQNIPYRGIDILRDGLENTTHTPDQVPLLALEYIRYAGVAHESRRESDLDSILSFIAQAEGVSAPSAREIWDSPLGTFFQSSKRSIQAGLPTESNGPNRLRLECSLDPSTSPPTTVISMRRAGEALRTHRLPRVPCGAIRWSPNGRYVAMSSMNTAVAFSGETGELVGRLPMCDRAFTHTEADGAFSCAAGTHALVLNEERAEFAIIIFNDGSSEESATPPRTRPAIMRVYDLGNIERMSVDQLFSAEERQRNVTPDWLLAQRERDRRRVPYLTCGAPPIPQLAMNERGKPVARCRDQHGSATSSGFDRDGLPGAQFRGSSIDNSGYIHSYITAFANGGEGICGAAFVYRLDAGQPNPLTLESASQFIFWSRSDQGSRRQSSNVTLQQLQARAPGCVRVLREVVAAEPLP